jgi:hypothetical protein
MNARFVLGVYARRLQLETCDRHSGNTTAGFQMWMLSRSMVGHDTLLADLAGSAIDLAIMTTNGPPAKFDEIIQREAE